MVKIDIYMPEKKKLTHLSQSIAITYKKESFFVFLLFIIIFFLFICTFVRTGKYRLNHSFCPDFFFQLINLDSALWLLDFKASCASQKKNLLTLSLFIFNVSYIYLYIINVYIYIYIYINIYRHIKLN